MKKAIVLGATGMVGTQLVRQLLKDSRYEKVATLVRKNSGNTHPKLEEHVVDFDAPDTWKKLVTGDVLYSAMGTTIRQAGSKDVQFKVDYTYQYNVAKAAAANDVAAYVLVSAAGSNPNSKIFYSRIKGELERDVQKLPFDTIHIIRPGMLIGARKDKRAGEEIGGAVLKLLGAIPGLASLKPIEATEVAKAMVNATFKLGHGIHSYTLKEVFKLAKPI